MEGTDPYHVADLLRKMIHALGRVLAVFGSDATDLYQQMSAEWRSLQTQLTVFNTTSTKVSAVSDPCVRDL